MIFFPTTYLYFIIILNEIYYFYFNEYTSNNKKIKESKIILSFNPELGIVLKYIHLAREEK